MATAIRSVGRALDILEAVSRHSEVGVNELARQLRSEPSTISRQLSYLTDRGYVTRDGKTGGYRLGLATYALINEFDPVQYLKAVAGVRLRGLRDQTGDSTAVYILEGDERLCLQQEMGTSGVLRVFRVGTPESLWPLGSAGLALLSSLDEDSTNALLSQASNYGYDPIRLHAELSKVRRESYAESYEDRMLGAAGISAPIRNSLGIIAAVTLGTSSARLKAADVGHIAQLVTATAKEISALLTGPNLSHIPLSSTSIRQPFGPPATNRT